MSDIGEYSAKTAILDLDELKSSGYAVYHRRITLPLVPDENDPRYLVAIVPPHACSLEIQRSLPDRNETITDGKLNALVDAASVGGISRSYLNMTDPEGHETNKWAENCTRVEFSLDGAIATPRTRLKDGFYLARFKKEELDARIDAVLAGAPQERPPVLIHQPAFRQEHPVLSSQNEPETPVFSSTPSPARRIADLALI